MVYDDVVGDASTCDVFPQELVTALPYFNASGSDGTPAWGWGGRFLRSIEKNKVFRKQMNLDACKWHL